MYDTRPLQRGLAPLDAKGLIVDSWCGLDAVTLVRRSVTMHRRGAEPRQHHGHLAPLVYHPSRELIWSQSRARGEGVDDAETPCSGGDMFSQF